MAFKKLESVSDNTGVLCMKSKQIKKRYLLIFSRSQIFLGFSKSLLVMLTDLTIIN